MSIGSVYITFAVYGYGFTGFQPGANFDVYAIVHAYDDLTRFPFLPVLYPDDFQAVVSGYFLLRQIFRFVAFFARWRIGNESKGFERYIHDIAAFGGVIAIVVVKQMFGGIGQNFVNPALTARIILMNSFPAKMTAWTAPMDHSFSDAMTTATPLGVLSEGTGAALPSYLDMFLGNTGGCLGETCALALILGGIYLVARRVISPVIPVTYLATAAVLSALLGRDPLMDILSGGLLLGAIFMATDYTTSPINFSARVIYAVGCGVLTILIRQFASLPEGVSYSIVLMNILVPLIERVAKPQTFGKMKAKKAGDAK